MMSTSQNTVAIVTGGAEGIGWATAQRLAQDHAHVVLLDLDAEKAVARAVALGSSHLGLGGDVASEGDVTAAVSAVIERFGRVDVLVNNAGVADQSAATIDQSIAHFDRVLAIHLRGTFLLSQTCARHMLARKSGAIINLSSIAGIRGHSGRNAYGAAKAGISSMTRSMACEWAAHGVRVNAVAPGYVGTELVRKFVDTGIIDYKSIVDRTPMGRLAEPAEIAEAIAFLASARASYINGVTLPVDGGWLALGMARNPDV